MEVAIPGDPEGGISKIYAGSLKHQAWEDDKYLKELVERYSTGGKAPDGTPDRTRVLGRFGAEQALQEAIECWTGDISMPALNKFIELNFDKVWSTYDGYEQDQVRLSEGPTLLREIMSKDTGKLPKNPLAIEGATDEEPLPETEVEEEKAEETVPAEEQSGQTDENQQLPAAPTPDLGPLPNLDTDAKLLPAAPDIDTAAPASTAQKSKPAPTKASNRPPLKK